MVKLKVRQKRYNADLKEFRTSINKPKYKPDTGRLIMSKTDKEFSKFLKSQKKLRKSRSERVKRMSESFKR